MIELTNVSKSFDGGRTFTVQGVDLKVAPGELMILLGSSGCGKTTTLKMINRLVEKTSGSIVVDGESTDAVDPIALRRRIGYVFQNIGLFPHMTVRENIAVVPGLLGWDPVRTRDRVDALLERVELSPVTFAGRLPEALSGGQRQRVGFARALAAEPRVMLLDEPFGALDPITRDRLQVHFKNLQRELGLTAVAVTHDITEALLLGDRIAVMDGGRVVQCDTPEVLLRAPATPYVEELMRTPKRQATQLEHLLT